MDFGYDLPMKQDTDYVDGETFHRSIRRVYSGALNWAVNKKREYMARVVYDRVHENPSFEDERRGKGKDFATWIFSEEEGLRENLFTTGFELMIDARLEPGASIGLHSHSQTEEIYYILEGSIEMSTVHQNGETFRQNLLAGDAHMVRLGQSHFGTAGPDGVRFIAVAVRKTR